LELIYGELRSIARRQMARVPQGDTLQPTALVNEAYLRLFGKDDLNWECRAHFLNAAARAMRDILVEQARKHASRKRGGDRRRLSFDDVTLSVTEDADDLIALDEALRGLEATDERSTQIVMLRFFAGLTVDDTARAMGISDATVERHWRYARAWLHRRVVGDEDAPQRGSADGR
jgi:RNA polymerase sigma factor (TIGR02999 family)